MPKLRNFIADLEKKSDTYLVDFDPWYPKFEKYMLDYYVNTLEEFDNIEKDEFNKKLTQFLFSPHGGKYKSLFKFENETDLKCG